MWGDEMEELQTQFNELTQRKIELWEQIKANALYELTEQWKEIESIDRQLFSLKAQIEGGNA